MLPVAILAGGLSTRLRPLTETVPKSLISINGEPFIVHQLRLLALRRVDRVVLCVGHMGEMIREFIGDGRRWGIQVEYSFDGDFPLGTGGALRKAAPLLGDRFLVLYGDSYLPCDYSEVARSFKRSKKLGLMTVFRNEQKWDTSNVEFRDGQVAAYDKFAPTPSMQFIDYGLGALRAEALASIPSDRATDLSCIYRDLLSRGELAGLEVRERFYEIGSMAGLKETSDYLATVRMQE